MWCGKEFLKTVGTTDKGNGDEDIMLMSKSVLEITGPQS
jgi:hypothetical protein